VSPRSKAERVEAPQGASRPWRLLATLGGLGALPVAPGTAGSLVGLCACLPLLWLGWVTHLAAALVLAVVAALAADRVVRETGDADPQSVVVDEAVGMWLAALAVPAQPYELFAVFVLFRIFDVVKPTPIPRLERLPGGWGVVADDVAAGLLARATWWLLKANFDFL
jgi:phosphatidylglycerophosphatase A